MVPPLGAIIVGSCPECSELVAVFCGHVLPLENKIMSDGTSEERQKHLMTTITNFLEDRIAKLVEETTGSSEFVASHHFGSDVKHSTQESPSNEFISDDEFEHFKDTELQLLDNKDYFELFFS